MAMTHKKFKDIIEFRSQVVIFSMLAFVLLPIASFEVSAISISGPSLKQIPSDASDFTNHNDRTIKVLFVNVYKNRIGSWHMTGQIQNMGNETLNFIRPHAQLVDANGKVVGLINGFTRNFHLSPGESSEIGGVALQESITGMPFSFKLGFEWK